VQGDELRALRELQRRFPNSAFVFTTERKKPFSPETVNQLVKIIGKRAKLPFPGSLQHVATRLRLRLGQCGALGASHSGLAWAQGDPSYRSLHEALRG
jgi:hypothetical protein